jgi:hypothetical protein
MESADALTNVLAMALAKQRVRIIVESVFGGTAEYMVLKSLCAAERPLLLAELARTNGLERSAIVSYSKGSRKYEGEIRAALERLVEKTVVVTDESRGRTRYRLNLSDLNGLLLGELMSPRRALID